MRGKINELNFKLESHPVAQNREELSGLAISTCMSVITQKTYGTS